jgi:hypothetical protein
VTFLIDNLKYKSLKRMVAGLLTFFSATEKNLVELKIVWRGSLVLHFYLTNYDRRGLFVVD